MNMADVVIDTLVEHNIIPQSGLFVIDDWLLDTYCHMYRNIKRDPNSSFDPEKGSPKRYARKVAGVVLNRLLSSRLPSVTITHESKLYNNTKSGFVYVLTNPAFEGYYKIGMTTDLNKRLQTYQTYNPLRRYKIHHNIFVSNRREAERKVLESFDVSLVKGEWIQSDKVMKIFHSLVESK